MSSFKGHDLFGSGPHRFAMGVQGQSVIANIEIGGSPPGSTPQGVRERDVIVTGRLVAGGEASLSLLRSAVTDLITHPPVSGELVDDHGRVWDEMSLIEYREADRVDRGRAWSVAYRAVFRRFAT